MHSRTLVFAHVGNLSLCGSVSVVVFIARFATNAGTAVAIFSFRICPWRYFKSHGDAKIVLAAHRVI